MGCAPALDRARRTPRAAAMIAALAVVLAFACTDRTSPAAPRDSVPTVPPDTTHVPDTTTEPSSNLVHACKPGHNALAIHTTRYLQTIPPARITVNVGDTTYFADQNAIAVLPAMVGQAALLPSLRPRYIAPTACTGTDSVWYTLHPAYNDASVDTSLLIVTVTHPPILAPDTISVVEGGEKDINVLGPRPPYAPIWTSPRIIGFLGTSRGSTPVVADSLIGYIAPAGMLGVDSVRVIAEADYRTVIIRDTTLLRVTLLARGPVPTYTVTAVVPASPGVILTAQGLSTDGRVAGIATFSDGSTHAFAWTAGQYTDLGAFNGARTAAVGINMHGDVAGYARKSDSTYQGLVWSANGAISEVPGGRPTPVGIADDGSVLTDGDDYWRGGAVVTKITGIPQYLTYGGLSAILYDDLLYPTCGFFFPDGRFVYISANRSTYFLGLNDSADFLALGVNAISQRTQVLYENQFVATYSPTAVLASAVWPEVLPPNYATPPFANPANATDPLVLDGHRSYLTSTTVVTIHGAFAIEPQIGDKTWHLVRAITMNDAGQILAVGQNATTGATGPIVLTPR